jgi:RNA recognition motif-containing protein
MDGTGMTGRAGTGAENAGGCCWARKHPARVLLPNSSFFFLACSHVRERTPPEVRLQREKEQELKDLERAVRTVMVMNINLKADERDIFNFFASVGRINDIKLIRDKHTKKSKGIAYVEFSTVEAAISALTLNGQILLSMPVLIKPSEAEKVRKVLSAMQNTMLVGACFDLAFPRFTTCRTWPGRLSSRPSRTRWQQ